ncbi:MAG: SMC-Scp complex subunit ScpB [Bacteroidia bacterium]
MQRLYSGADFYTTFAAQTERSSSMSEHISQIIESIIFVSDQPVDTDALLAVLNGEDQKEATPSEEEKPKKDQYGEKDIAPVLEALVEKYSDDRYPFEVKKIAKGYQFFTKRPYHSYVKRATLEKNKRRLSRAAMETLAIVAYRQPVTKAEVEFVRGVNCDYAIQKLLEKQLVAILGRADAVGRPLLYGTSAFFMQHFGINGVDDLPKLKEFDEMVDTHQELFKQHQQDLENTGGEGSDARVEKPEETVQTAEQVQPDHGETESEEAE